MKRTKSGALHAHSHAYAKQLERAVLPPLDLALSSILRATLAIETAQRATGYDCGVMVNELQKFEKWCKEKTG